MASLDDILTTQRNGVVGINSIYHANINIVGSTNTGEISGGTTKYFPTSLGRVVKVSVLVAGSTVGTIYDANSVSSAGVGNRIAFIINTVGIYDISMPLNNGLVIQTGTGQTVVVSYS